MKKKQTAGNVAFPAMMIAVAMIFSYVETMIPFNFGIPGIKLGLANLAIVVSLYLLGGKKTLIISLTRIILSGFLFGNFASILYSLAGGMLSLAIMVLMKRSGKLSPIPVSVIGGICHNAGQLIVAVLVVQNLRVAYYFPVLLIAGFLTGLLIGIIASLVLPALRSVRRTER